MADYPASPENERDYAPRRPNGAAMGLDPVSPSRFGEIIDADRETRDYDIHRQPNTFDMKRDRISRATWVMIVVAGVVLGVAMAMIAAG